MDRDEIVSTLARIEANQTQLARLLTGNGQPGFIATTNGRISELEDTAATAKGALAVIGAITTAVGGTLLTHLFRGKP